MEVLTDNLGVPEHEELAVVIYDYPEMCRNSGPTDI